MCVHASGALFPTTAIFHTRPLTCLIRYRVRDGETRERNARPLLEPYDKKYRGLNDGVLCRRKLATDSVCCNVDSSDDICWKQPNPIVPSAFDFEILLSM